MRPPFSFSIKCLLIPLLLLVVSCGSSPDETGLPHYSFFVAGHIYGSSENPTTGVYQPFLNYFPKINADTGIGFGVLTGDVVYESTDSSWNLLERDLNLLDCDIYIAPGNHDLKNPEPYLARYGPLYYHFKHGEDLFLILDGTSQRQQIAGDQLNFVKTTLRDHSPSARNIFVFFHQQLWWSPTNKLAGFVPNIGDDSASTPNFWNEVLPLFSSTKKPVYMFAGDAGAFPNGNDLLYHKVDNVHLIASGMGGGKGDNFIVVRQYAEQTSFEVISLNDANPKAMGKLEEYTIGRRRN